MDYNSRLFQGSKLRSWYHIARFDWLGKQLSNYNMPMRVVELGCFDGRVLDYIDKENLDFYHGYDANWEGGLSKALCKSHPKKVLFSECQKSQEIDVSENFNVFISLETLEHLENNDLADYLAKIKEILVAEAKIFVSVPNEVGLLFIGKTILKKILNNNSNGYSFYEFIHQALGNTRNVRRNQHKGFNWKELKLTLENSFGCDFHATGIHFPYLPIWCSPSIGLVGKMHEKDI